MVDQPNTGGYAQTQCYEPLNDAGECPFHGQQVMVKPDWMSDAQWQNSLRDLRRQTVTLRYRHINTSDGSPSSRDSK
jgi:hypothetical protein